MLFVGVAAAALIAPAAVSAQETTAILRGSVVANGAPVAGATVVITNVPSGTRTEQVTGADGNFLFTGQRAGGPFTVEVTSPQGNQTVTDIFLVVGQPYDLPVDLSATDLAASDAGAGQDIVVTASRIRGAGVTSDGPQTVLGTRDIQKVASVNRDIRDIQRRDPFATLDLSNNRAVSFAGTNPRFNRFSINGVAVSDNFGLNPDASPTGRGPVPFDALAQVSVSIAPYDFRQGDFQGGAIDAVLLSGTNEFHGTGFYSQNTDELFGERIGSFTRPPVDYKSETYGATFSGPIVRDKLFFMVSAERNTDPRPFSIAAANQIPFGTRTLTDGDIANVSNIARSVYGYETGGFLSLADQKDEKIVGKIDWNIADNQRLAVTYINAYNEFEFQQNTSNSNALQPTVGLESNGYRLTELLRAGIVQLNSDWTDNFSTEVRGVYRSYTREQDPLLGRGFAQFRVCLDAISTGVLNQCSNGTPVVAFGPDISRQANEFDSETFGGSVLARLTEGDHQIAVLAEFERTKIFNLFLQNATGAYYFDSLADFGLRRAQTLTYQNAVSLNLDDAAARFGYVTFTAGAQDRWEVNEDLTLTYGFRYDLFGSRSEVPFNPNFLARNGFPNTRTYKGLGVFQPRASFDYDVAPRLKIRGGAGVFGGGNPDVYLSNSYSNTGIVTNSVNVNRTGTSASNTFNVPVDIGTAALNGVAGNSIPAALNNFLSTNTGALATAPVNALAPSFDLPSTLKATLSVDYNIFGFDVGADYIYSNTIKQVLFTDARSVVVGRLPDGRNRYAARTNAGGLSFTDANQDIILSNTGQGRGHIWDVRFSRTFDFGLSLGGSYAWQNVTDASPATSSTAGSNYGNGAFADPDFAALGRSNDETRWQFKYSVGFDRKLFGDYRTGIQLFGETRAGRNYSFTMQDPTGGNTTRSAVFGTPQNNSRYLLYVPTGNDDPIVSYDNAGTRDALNTLIENTPLKNYRGRISGRNIARSRAFTRIDLHAEQEVPTGIGGSRVTLFADIENLPNLLNREWGGLRQQAFPFNATVVTVQCLTAATATGQGVANVGATAAQNPAGLPTVVATSAAQPCAQYRYSSYRDPSISEKAINVAQSLYLIRLGARFSF